MNGASPPGYRTLPEVPWGPYFVVEVAVGRTVYGCSPMLATRACAVAWTEKHIGKGERGTTKERDGVAFWKSRSEYP